MKSPGASPAPTPRSQAISAGGAGEAAVAYELAIRGWAVCLPAFGHSSPFDLVAVKKGVTRLIQVKTATCEARGKCPGTWSFTMRKGRSGKNITKCYNPGDFDVAILFVSQLREFFILPFNVVSGITSLQVREGGRGRYWKYRDRWDLVG